MDNPHVILEKEDFKEVMIETRDLLNRAMKFENNMMHPENMFEYDKYAPYLLNIAPERYDSPGYKIGFLQSMSIVMALREKNNKNHYTDGFYDDDNVVNFSRYKIQKKN